MQGSNLWRNFGRSSEHMSITWKVGTSRNSSWLQNSPDPRSGLMKIRWVSSYNLVLEGMHHVSRSNAARIGLLSSQLRLKRFDYSSFMDTMSLIRTLIFHSGYGEVEVQIIFANLSFSAVKKMKNGFKFLGKGNRNPMLKLFKLPEFSILIVPGSQFLIACNVPLMDRRQLPLQL